MRESLRREYDVRARRSLSVSTTANEEKDAVVTLVERPNIPPAEQRSFVRDAFATLLVVYGGEAMICPYISVPPSFVFSGATPLLYILGQALVEALPTSAIPMPTITTELPLSLLDGFTRAILLCTLIPPTVQSSPVPELSQSPWVLILGSFIIANGGFFLTNLFSFFLPTPLALTTPPELLPYGWTTTDLWCAPVVTAVYATLTHAQPFWADVHSVLGTLAGGGGYTAEAKLEPLDAEMARAACALILTGLFVTRTARTYGVGPFSKGAVDKIKTN
ncbi:hypothetical protein SCLCIDRAFT_1219594 [Scleroderma citrinum Foug A]|uniref:Uncharacterized protein n=1 Tax=Scleroderma citrinum Foug A TaxID=1036808 RepID=A0A0C2ZXS7_9AGAM|nr:hypothetical protein SCLCIDRAFT_1219594 [Scleroderma citrinum Foug A]